MVVPHLLVAVRFPSDFERAVAPRAQGADARTAQLFRYQLGIAVLIYLWDIDVLGLRFLAQPAVTSASEVLDSDLSQQRIVAVASMLST